jgi:hypothetical protein
MKVKHKKTVKHNKPVKKTVKYNKPVKKVKSKKK